jgi:hypothetical protein
MDGIPVTGPVDGHPTYLSPGFYDQVFPSFIHPAILFHEYYLIRPVK